MVDRQEPGGQRQFGPVEHRPGGQPDLALAAVALVDRAALEFGIAPVPAARAGPALAPAELEQRRPASFLRPKALPELGLAQTAHPPPQPALCAHPPAPHRPKTAPILAQRRMGVTDNQVTHCRSSRSTAASRLPWLAACHAARAVSSCMPKPCHSTHRCRTYDTVRLSACSRTRFMNCRGVQ